MDYIVPEGTAPGTATVNLLNGSTVIATGTAQVQSVAPAIFTANGNGKRVAAALALRAGGDPAPIFQCPGGAGTCQSTPVDVSGGAVYLSLFGTGTRNRTSLENVTCTIEGVMVPVLYAGAHPGLDQVNVKLAPESSGSGATQLALRVDGRRANTVRINIQ